MTNAPPAEDALRDAPLFIVLNAASGRDDGETRRQTMEQVFTAARRPYELLMVHEGRQLPDVARRAVEQALDVNGIVVASGGDGTINAVAQAVMGSGLPFGALPQGTFNYFGRSHGIPADLTDAARTLLDGSLQPVQVGLINDRVFLVNASLGLYPRLLEDREAYNQRYGRSRWVALLSVIATVLREHRELVIELDHEGKTELIRTSALVVGNNVLQLEQLGMPQASALERGQLAAMRLKPIGTFAMFNLLMQAALGQLGKAENVQSFTFRKLTVRPRSRYRRQHIKVATDGEIAWLLMPLVFEVAPHPLLLVVPRAPHGEPQ